MKPIKYPVTKYWADSYWLEKAIALLRETTTKTGVGQRLMSTGTKGQWRDAHITIGNLIFNWMPCTLPEAAEIAARLGGSLQDDGGIVPIGRNGPFDQ
jgi:hypothetical protein